MMQGNNPPSLADSTAIPNMPATAIPIQSVDADQLPREKGWTYDEMAGIVGSLYLDSSHQLKIREEQFRAVISEYDKRILQIQAQEQIKQEEVDGLRKQIATLTSELEVRNGNSGRGGPGGITSSGHDGRDAMSGS